MTDQPAKAQLARQAETELTLTAQTIKMIRAEAHTALEQVGITMDEAYALSADLRAVRALERRLFGVVQSHENDKILQRQSEQS